MGSYLTIVNNTPDNWRCKVGTDMRMIEFADFLALAIGACALLVATAGMAAPFVASMAADGCLTIYGVTAASLVTITASAEAVESAATIVDGTTGFSIAVAKGVGVALEEKGFKLILKDERYRYGKMTLSLWQQGTCIKTTIHERVVELDTLEMRPIFSGHTINSNLDYDIATWLTKKPVRKDVIRGQTGPKPEKKSHGLSLFH